MGWATSQNLQGGQSIQLVVSVVFCSLLLFGVVLRERFYDGIPSPSPSPSQTPEPMTVVTQYNSFISMLKRVGKNRWKFSLFLPVFVMKDL